MVCEVAGTCACGGDAAQWSVDAFHSQDCFRPAVSSFNLTLTVDSLFSNHSEQPGLALPEAMLDFLEPQP